jgi:hypothetical protein
MLYDDAFALTAEERTVGSHMPALKLQAAALEPLEGVMWTEIA